MRRHGLRRATARQDGVAQLQAAGFQVDYAVVRLPDLGEPGEGEGGARVALVAARLTATWLSARRRLIRGTGRGVVVTIWRGLSPRRSPNCSMSQHS